MLPLLLGWIVGTAVQLQQVNLSIPSVYTLFLAVASVFIVSLAIKNIVFSRLILTSVALGRFWRYAAPFVLFVASACVAFGLTGWRATNYLEQTLSPSLEGRDVQVVGIVAAMPQRSEAGLRFRLEVESASLWTEASKDAPSEKTPINIPPLIDLSWYGGVFMGATMGDDPFAELKRQPAALTTELKPGERWQMTVRLKAPHGNSNPNGFDYELYLWEQGVQATGYVRATARDIAPVQLADTWWHPVERLRVKVRDAVFARLKATSSVDSSDTNELKSRDRNAGVVAALITGDQHAIDRADWDVFRATGVAHLMSISGLHITMFAWGAALLVGWLWRRSSRLCLAIPAPYIALVGGVFLATLYAVFSGWGIPSQRTILMLLTVSVLKLLGRRWPWPIVWLLACAVVVAFDPWALMQAGFWLSFVAVGVLFATDVSGQNSLEQRAQVQSVQGSWFKRFKASLQHGAREQMVITLALTPLTLLLFGQVSVVGLLANAVAIPWVTLVVTPLSMVGTVYAPIWDLAAWAVQGLSIFLGFLASWSFATVSVAQPSVLVSIIGVIGGLFLVMPWPWRLRMLGLPLLLPVVLWQAPRPLEGEFELLAADIGQGNAVIVRTARHTLVYDAGPRFSAESDAGHRVLVPLLRSLGERVDTVMLSHRDIDHSGGIKSVLAMHPNADFISSIEDAHELHAVKSATRCIAGQHWHWEGVDFTVLHPTSQDYESPQKSNAMSCVLRVSSRMSPQNGVHQNSALLVGDIEQAQEVKLLETFSSTSALAPQLQSTVLLVPHHGSKTSSSEPFLDAVKPSLAIVQAGYRNRFKHPATNVMARYAQRDIQVVDSAHCGAVRWMSDQPGQFSCERQSARRYWQHRVP